MELTFEKWEDGRWFVILPEWDGLQEDVTLGCVIHLATVVLESVADYQIIHFQQKIVDRNLVEGLLLKLYSRGFVLDDHARHSLFII